jgi:hypothetical protein
MDGPGDKLNEVRPGDPISSAQHNIMVQMLRASGGGQAAFADSSGVFQRRVTNSIFSLPVFMAEITDCDYMLFEEVLIGDGESRTGHVVVPNSSIVSVGTKLIIIQATDENGETVFFGHFPCGILDVETTKVLSPAEGPCPPNPSDWYREIDACEYTGAALEILTKICLDDETGVIKFFKRPITIDSNGNWYGIGTETEAEAFSTVEVTVVTDFRVDGDTNKLQMKTRTIRVVQADDESDWIDVHTGDNCEE